METLEEEKLIWAPKRVEFAFYRPSFFFLLLSVKTVAAQVVNVCFFPPSFTKRKKNEVPIYDGFGKVMS